MVDPAPLQPEPEIPGGLGPQPSGLEGSEREPYAGASTDSEATDSEDTAALGEPDPVAAVLDLSLEMPESDLLVWGEPVLAVPPDHRHDEVLDLAADPREAPTPAADLAVEELEVNVAVGPAQADVKLKARDIFRNWLINIAVSCFILAVGVGLLALMVPEQSDLIFAGWVGFSLMIITLGWLDPREPGRP